MLSEMIAAALAGDMPVEEALFENEEVAELDLSASGARGSVGRTSRRPSFSKALSRG